MTIEPYAGRTIAERPERLYMLLKERNRRRKDVQIVVYAIVEATNRVEIRFIVRAKADWENSSMPQAINPTVGLQSVGDSSGLPDRKADEGLRENHPVVGAFLLAC